MGDRCYMQITCRKQDVKKFTEKESYGFDVEDKGGKLVQLGVDEVNYGNTGDLPKGIPFIGWHSEGGGYGGRFFATDGTVFDGVEQGHGNNGYVVQFDEDTGEPFPQHITDIKNFIQFRNQVRKIMEETSVEPPEEEKEPEVELTLEDWVDEVQQGDTKLGFEEWVKHNKEGRPG